MPQDTKPWPNAAIDVVNNRSKQPESRQTREIMHREIIISGDDALARTIAEELRGAGARIIQITTGGAAYLSGPTIKNMASGAIALAGYAHEVAQHYDVHVALHTDHCQKDKLDEFVRPLLAASVVIEVAAALVARAASPAQVHALLAPLRALGVLAVTAIAFERIATVLARAIEP